MRNLRQLTLGFGEQTSLLERCPVTEFQPRIDHPFGGHFAQHTFNPLILPSFAQASLLKLDALLVTLEAAGSGPVVPARVRKSSRSPATG